MKVAVTTVGSKGPEDAIKNEGRLKAGKQAIEEAKSLQAEVLVLPGGFLVSNDSISRSQLANSLIHEAECLDIAIAFGVDVHEKDNNDKYNNYGYAWSPATPKQKPDGWKQRSGNRREKILPESYEEARLLQVGNASVGILVCGEIFNKDIIATSIKNKPKIVVDLVHGGKGFEVHGAMRKLYRNGIASVCSLHALCKNPVKRCYIPGNGKDGNVSTRDFDRVIEGPPRIELKLFEVL
jgi:hypothetical protein